MSAMDKISIVVPVYNLENCIESTVASIQSQTYRNIEIILVNDGSNDSTPQILDRLAATDERIRVIHQSNSGVTNARLHGVVEATGQWIGFVDGDDYIEPDMYELLLRNAQTYGADISHCGYQMVFPSRVDYYYNTGRLAQHDKGEALMELLAGSIEPGLWNKLFRRDLFHRLLHDDVMDATIRINEDLLMNFYLFREAESSVFEDVCPYHYCLRKGSAATSELNANKLCDPLRVLRILEAETAKTPELQQIIRRRIVAVLVSLATLGDGKQRDLIQPCKENARRELTEMRSSVIRGRFSVKQKLMTLWVCIWPASYRWIHSAYARIRGTDKKYEVR